MAKSKKGSLASKVKQSVSKHRKDATNYGNMNLPAGIQSGVAKIVECKFEEIPKGKRYEGEYRFVVSGVVKEPKSHEGQVVAGLRISKFIPVCDQVNRAGEVYATLDDQVSTIMNEMRKLGIDTADMDAEDLEDTAAVIKEEGNLFKFSTVANKASNGNTYINEYWNGLYDGDLEEEDDEVEDSTDEDDEDDIEEEEDDYDDVEEDDDDDDDEDEEAEEEEVVPEVEELYFYKPKGSKEAISVEVTKIIKAKKLANLLNMEDEETEYKNVPWAELKQEA